LQWETNHSGYANNSKNCLGFFGCWGHHRKFDNCLSVSGAGRYFSLHQLRFNDHFVVDLDLRLSDGEIWEYASLHNLIILTKDTDFYYRCITSENPVKVIHFQFGNFTLKQLRQFFFQNWPTIESKISEATLLIVEEQQIRVVF
jgi:predicted nuclease of predicted toxin-antitoxin system